jgi:predicted nucleic acid-binding protein
MRRSAFSRNCTVSTPLVIALSSITLTEVLTGPPKAGKPAPAKRYKKGLSLYEVISVSTPIAALIAQLRTKYRLKPPDAIQKSPRLWKLVQRRL